MQISRNTLQKPRILIIIATAITGGPGKGLFQLLKRLKGFGLDYTLCNFQRRYSKRESDQFREAAKTLGIDLLLIKQYFPIDPLIIFRANQIRIQHKANILQTHGYKPNILGFFLKLLTGVPWIAFAHGYTTDNWKVKIYNRLDLSVLNFADTIVAVSDSIKTMLRSNGIKSSKIKIIQNAVDRDELTPDISPDVMRASLGIKNNQTVIGVVGRLGPEKGQIIFLKAFQRVLRSIADVTALIIGDGQEKGRLVNFCRTATISDHVIFTGHVNNVSNYYQIVDLFVLPSFSEGLPNVLLEAMVFGIPVIATSVGGIPEVINKNNGVMVSPGDYTSMAHAILELILDERKRDRLAINARKDALNIFDPSFRAQKLSDLYQHLLRNGK